MIVVGNGLHRALQLVADAGAGLRLPRQADVARQDAHAHTAAQRQALVTRPQAAFGGAELQPRQLPRRIALGDRALQHHAGTFALRRGQIQPRQHVGQRPGCGDLAVRHQHQLVGELRDLVDRMADIDHRNVQLGMQPPQIGQHLGLARRIQRRQRLVHQQQARPGGQRARHGHALPLAARQGVGPARHQVADAQQLDGLLQGPQRTGVLRSRRSAASAVVEVAAHIQMREQGRILDHVAQRAVVRRHEAACGIVLPDLVAEAHVAGGTLQPSQCTQHAGLAAA